MSIDHFRDEDKASSLKFLQSRIKPTFEAFGLAINILKFKGRG